MKILIIGPFPPPVTGNSLVNKLVAENLPKFYADIEINKINNAFPVLKEDLGQFSIRKVFFYLIQYLKIFSYLQSKNI